MIPRTGGCAIAGILALAAPAFGVDGVIEINNARAVAGGVAPGDAPGYPVTIDRSGSYRLTGNLFVSGTNIDVVEVDADDVTLDLNGFTIRCLFVFDPCAGNGTGVGIDASLTLNFTVRNGTVRDMPDDGIVAGLDARIERVRVLDNGGSGIVVVSGYVVGNMATGNAVGIASTAEAGDILALDNFTHGNSAFGFSVNAAPTLGRNHFPDGANAEGGFNFVDCNHIGNLTVAASCPP